MAHVNQATPEHPSSDVKFLNSIETWLTPARAKGIRLNSSQGCWEVSGTTSFPELLRAVEAFFPPGCSLYFEGGSPDEIILDFLLRHKTDQPCQVAAGTLWPRPAVFHINATGANLTTLARLMTERAYPELAIHFHVYRDGKVLLEWHDAFSQPMLLSDDLPEARVADFAKQLRMTYEWINPRS